MNKLDELVRALKRVTTRLEKHVEQEKHLEFRENWIDVKVLKDAKSMLEHSYHPLVGNRMLLTMTTIEEITSVLRNANERLKIHNERHLHGNEEDLLDMGAIELANHALQN